MIFFMNNLWVHVNKKKNIYINNKNRFCSSSETLFLIGCVGYFPLLYVTVILQNPNNDYMIIFFPMEYWFESEIRHITHKIVCYINMFTINCNAMNFFNCNEQLCPGEWELHLKTKFFIVLRCKTKEMQFMLHGSSQSEQ